MRRPSDLSPRLTPTVSHMPAHGSAAPAEFMRPTVEIARPDGVDQLSWELLSIHIEEARRGGSISGALLRKAAISVVTQLRKACVAWEEVYAVLDRAVMEGRARPAMHMLERELYASRSTAIVAHMHSWADVQRLAELEDPCAEP